MQKRRLVDLPKKLFKLPILESILSKLTQNKKPDQFFARLAPFYKTYPGKSFRRITRNGIHYELDISDYMEWLIFYGIEVEPHQALYDLVKPGYFILDIGANVGETTLNMAKLVGTAGRVHSFEPDSLSHLKISKNIGLNIFQNIKLNPLAMGDNEGEVLIGAQVEDNRGGVRILHEGAGQKVTMSTIDKYLSKEKIQKIDLIKIDVEGFEKKVIAGAHETIKKFMPILFIEINDDNLRAQGDSAHSILSLLESSGYRNISDAETGMKISSQSDFNECHFDLIAR